MAGETKKSIVNQIDLLTRQQSIMQADHTYVHAGIAFTTAIDTGSISAAYHIILETPAGSSAYFHYRPAFTKISSDADAIKFELLEGITSYSGGTVVTPFNRNRNKTNTSTATVKKGITPVIGTPITIDIAYYGTSGTRFTRSGGGGGSGQEIILKPSTIYCYRITPAGATNVSLSNFWYEEEST